MINTYISIDIMRIIYVCIRQYLYKDTHAQLLEDTINRQNHLIASNISIQDSINLVVFLVFV